MEHDRGWKYFIDFVGGRWRRPVREAKRDQKSGDKTGSPRKAKLKFFGYLSKHQNISQVLEQPQKISNRLKKGHNWSNIQ